MNLLRKPKDWPYAADSVGVPNGTLKIQRRHIPCYTIVGSALVESEKLKEEIIDHMQRKITELQEPEKYINVSAYMIGKHPRKTSPIVMILSDDNELRKTAFKSVQESRIMEKYPGFALGHRPLRDEFRDLRPLGDSYDDACTTEGFSTSGTTLSYGQVLHVDCSELAGLPEDRLPAELRSSAVYIDKKGPQTPLRLFHKTGVNSEVRSATAGGLLHFDGKYMLHTVQHFLEPTKQKCNYDTFEEKEQDDDCEVFGWDDSEDDADDFFDLVEITSRGSVSPSAELYDDEQSDTDVESISVLSSVLDARDPTLLYSRLEGYVAPPPDSSNFQSKESGSVILSSRELDFSLVEIDLETLQRLGIDPAAAAKLSISLDDFEDCIELFPPDKAAVTVATQGQRSISGILSGQSLAFCLPGSRKFVNVYSAKLDQPLKPGDCGSWVRSNDSGKVFGHIIAGSPSTGLVLVMPASRALGYASDSFGISFATPRNQNFRQTGVHRANFEEADLLCPSVIPQIPNLLLRTSVHQLVDNAQQMQQIRDLPLPYKAAALLRLLSRNLDRRHPVPPESFTWLDSQAQRGTLKLMGTGPYHEEKVAKMFQMLFSEVQEPDLQSSMVNCGLSSSFGRHLPRPHRILDGLSRIFSNRHPIRERNISLARPHLIWNDLPSNNEISTVFHDLIDSVDEAHLFSRHGLTSRWSAHFEEKECRQYAHLYNVWATGNSGGNSLWLHGVPGSGKSTILRLSCVSLDQQCQLLSRSLNPFTKVLFDRRDISPHDLVFRHPLRSKRGLSASEVSTQSQLVELLLACTKLQTHGDHWDLTWHREMLDCTDPGLLRSKAFASQIVGNSIASNTQYYAQHLAQDTIHEEDTEPVWDLSAEAVFWWNSRMEVFDWLPCSTAKGTQPDAQSFGLVDLIEQQMLCSLAGEPQRKLWWLSALMTKGNGDATSRAQHDTAWLSDAKNMKTNLSAFEYFSSALQVLLRESPWSTRAISHILRVQKRRYVEQIEGNTNKILIAESLKMDSGKELATGNLVELDRRIVFKPLAQIQSSAQSALETRRRMSQRDAAALFFQLMEISQSLEPGSRSHRHGWRLRKFCTIVRGWLWSQEYVAQDTFFNSQVAIAKGHRVFEELKKDCHVIGKDRPGVLKD